MRRAVWSVLIFLSLVVLFLLFGLQPLQKYFKIGDRAGISIQANVLANVSIDGSKLGNTPFQSANLQSGEHLVELTAIQGNWKGYVNISSGTSAIVDRDLEASTASSAGEVMTLDPGKGVVIMSNPSLSDVEIDNQPVGQTPLKLANLSAGEHLFLVRKDGFIPRSFRATVKSGYRLTLQVDLAVFQPNQVSLPTPAPLGVETMIVTQTPTGFLRVREQPSLDGNEIEEVHPGDELQLIQDQGDWDKVKLPDGKIGYTSSQYLQKK